MADVAPAPDAEAVCLGPMGTRPGDREPRIRTMPSKAPPLSFGSEAGPWGDWRYRELPKTGDACWGGAPALIPPKPGDRVTTDRRDAVHWARLARSGALPVVYVPQGADAARRERARTREDPLGDLQSAPCRLQAFWLRHDLRAAGRAPWGPAHRRWLSAVVGPTPAPPLVLQASVRAMHDHTERRPRLAQALQDQRTSWRLPPVGEALQALHGVQCLAAVTMGAARGDLTRFESPSEPMKFVGLRPSAYTRAARRRQGARPNAGNTHARTALVEGAWADRDPAKVSRHVQRRRANQPQRIQALRGTAQVRRGHRSRQRLARGQHATVVPVAMARELAGCLGAIATQVPVTP